MSSTSLGRQSDFRELFDQLEGIALWTATVPGTFDYISDGFEGIWGIPPEEVKDDVGRLIDSIHPDDRDRVRDNIESSSQELRDQSYEGRVIQPDGSVRWVLTRQVIIWNDDGEVSEVVGFSTDITEQKRREQELEVLNRIIRHDIRNDLSVMLGWAEVLKDHVDDDGTDYLEKILTSGSHIVELTEIARDYVETVISNEDLAVEPTSISASLETELSLREDSLPDAEFVIHDQVPDVDVAANQMLDSVFRNLLNNAVQHNDKDTPVVEVFSEVNEGEIEIRVADNGPGIPDEHKELIFGKGEKSLDSPGTGIGLYLVNTLVTQFDGTVWVEDNEPTGSVFIVRLPIVSE